MGTKLIIKNANFYVNRIYGDESGGGSMETEIETTTTGKYLNTNLSQTTLASYDIVDIPIPVGCTQVQINIYCGSVAYGYFIDSSDKFNGTAPSAGNILSETKTVPSGAEYIHLSYEARREDQAITQYITFTDGTNSYTLALPTE